MMLLAVEWALEAQALSAAVLVLCIAALVLAGRAAPARRETVTARRTVPWRVALGPFILAATLIAIGMLVETLPFVTRFMALLVGLSVVVWLRTQAVGGLEVGGRAYRGIQRTWHVPPRIASEDRLPVAALVVLGVFAVLLLAVGYIVGRAALAGVFG